jgi:hypothetical protein
MIRVACLRNTGFLKDIVNTNWITDNRERYRQAIATFWKSFRISFQNPENLGSPGQEYPKRQYPFPRWSLAEVSGRSADGGDQLDVDRQAGALPRAALSWSVIAIVCANEAYSNNSWAAPSVNNICK